MLATATETGLPPLVFAIPALGPKIVAVASAFGRYLALDAAFEWLLSRPEHEQAEASIELTSGAVKYYVETDLANWRSAAQKKYTGAALSSALTACSVAEGIIKRSGTTMAEMRRCFVELDALYKKLDAQSGSGGGGATLPAAPPSPAAPSGTSGGGTQFPGAPGPAMALGGVGDPGNSPLMIALIAASLWLAWKVL